MTFISAQATGTRPEDDLLLCCVRTYIDPERAERIRALLRHDIDWVYLIQAARSHEMMSLLYWSINTTCPEAVPKATLDQLRDYFHANDRRNRFLTREQLRLLNLLEAHRIPATAFKGPALAASIYGNLALRQFSDMNIFLDILVHKQDVLRARDLLVSLGYQPWIQLTSAQEEAFLKSECELTFESNDGRIIVVLRWGITPRYFSFPLDIERLWERLEPISLDGKEILTLSPEDLLLILCVHGSKGCWEQLDWIFDVAKLIDVHQGMDWERVMEQAVTLGSERMLCLGLFLATDLLGAVLPEEVLQKVQADSVVKSLATQVRERIFHDVYGLPGVFERFLFHLRMRERLRDRVLYCLRLPCHAMTPTPEDRALLPLPGSLSFLYYLLRLLRLVGKHGLGLLGLRFSLFRPRNQMPFEPTPMEVVERMLTLAGVAPTDVVYDLGCGDGRMVILAAKRYGACGVGVDINLERIAESNANARKEGMEHLVTFVQQDVMKVDLSPATVVTLYLLPSWNLKLRPKLQKELRPGARIVSHDFDMGDWAPLKVELVTDAYGVPRLIYLWRI